MRGLIVLSDDDGKTWRQARRTGQLRSGRVRFVTPAAGLGLGHDGVILATDDGGEPAGSSSSTAAWPPQLLTRAFRPARGQRRCQRGAAAQGSRAQLRERPRDADARPVVRERAASAGPSGPFGTLLGTRDGGKTWVSWIEKVDNPKMLHYNAVRGVGRRPVPRLRAGHRVQARSRAPAFHALSTGYKGSFFGVIGTRDYVIAYGLRGNGLSLAQRREQLGAPRRPA